MSRLLKNARKGAIPALTGAGLVMALSSCTSPQIASPCSIPAGATAAQQMTALSACFGQVSNDVVDTSLQKDLDILFMIDNSPSMSPKQNALATNIPLFIQAIDATGANYHVGITTSDIGSFTAPGANWSVSLGSCDSYEGDDGSLQATPCTARGNITSTAMSQCATLCPDPSYVPVDGSNFISNINGVNNIKSGDSTAPAKAFQCMAFVGDGGCGIEGQLEGAKRALNGTFGATGAWQPTNPANANFLRSDSVLAIIFITDEDDCSVQLSQRAQNNPVTMNCATPADPANYNCYNPDYRCIAEDFKCDQPLNETGTKTNCQERSSSYLEQVSDYVTFFQGLKEPSKLLVSGIWAPTFGTNNGANNSGQFIVTQGTGGSTSDTLNRAGADAPMSAACYDTNDSTVFARPQLRLSKFLSQFPDKIEQSICDTANYPLALSNIASTIKTKLGAQCISVVPKVTDGQPICLVGDVPANEQNSAPASPFPACTTSCCDAWASAAVPTAQDPGVMAACGGEKATCFCAVTSTVAGVCEGGAVAGVWRPNGGMAPAGDVTNFKCAKQ